jgi:hypothetical protein
MPEFRVRAVLAMSSAALLSLGGTITLDWPVKVTP